MDAPAAALAPDRATAWLALAIAVVTVLATISLALLFAIGQPFGSINDAGIGLEAVLTALLAWQLHAQYRTAAPALSYVALLAAVLGAAITVWGAYLVISGRTGFVLAGLYMSFGFGLQGLWLAGLSLAAQPGAEWPRALVLLGIVTGLFMAVGLLTGLGLAARVDSFTGAPWHVYLGFMGWLGWNLLLPVWAFALGRLLLSRLAAFAN
jgi:hypothetical protein